VKNCSSELETEFQPRFVLAFSKITGAFHRYTTDVGRPGTLGSDKILAIINVTTEDVDVGLWARPWGMDERCKSIPGSDAAIEVITLPGLAAMGKGLNERG